MDRVSCQVTPQEAELCRNHHRALAMLVYFKQTHGDQPFACDPEAIGPRLCMNHKTARHERDFLLKAGLLEVSDSNVSARRNPGRQPKAYVLKPAPSQIKDLAIASNGPLEQCASQSFTTRSLND